MRTFTELLKFRAPVKFSKETRCVNSTLKLIGSVKSKCSCYSRKREDADVAEAVVEAALVAIMTVKVIIERVIAVERA